MQTLSPHDRSYYEVRTEAELELAQQSVDSCAMKIHYDLANRYLSILHEGAEERPALSALDDAVRHRARAKVGKTEVSR